MSTTHLQMSEVKFLSWDDIPKRPTVIMISGKAGAGKTTLASYLCTAFSAKKRLGMHISFAEKIKILCRQFFLWDGLKDEKGRKLLQDVGRIGREYNIDIWVSHIVDSIYELLTYTDLYIIDDWRFENEYDYLSKEPFNLVTIRVLRDVPDLPGNLSNDISERSLDKFENFSYVIDNNGTLEDLKLKAEELVRQIILNKGEIQ